MPSIAPLISRAFLLVCLVGCLAGCTAAEAAKNTPPPDGGKYTVLGKVYRVMPSSLGYLDIGVASWYGRKFHGRLTSMGEVYDMHGLTAAHRALPLPTMVKVTNLDNGRKIVVRVNDRGPFHSDRVIDLSYGAARALGFEHQGIAPVVVEAVDRLNYPELIHEPELAPRPAQQTAGPSVYLQMGAYALREGAEARLGHVRRLLSDQAQSRILESETDQGVLYKVWVGPMKNEAEGQKIAALVSEELGKPLRVVVD